MEKKSNNCISVLSLQTKKIWVNYFRVPQSFSSTPTPALNDDRFLMPLKLSVLKQPSNIVFSLYDVSPDIWNSCAFIYLHVCCFLIWCFPGKLLEQLCVYISSCLLLPYMVFPRKAAGTAVLLYIFMFVASLQYMVFSRKAEH